MFATARIGYARSSFEVVVRIATSAMFAVDVPAVLLRNWFTVVTDTILIAVDISLLVDGLNSNLVLNENIAQRTFALLNTNTTVKIAVTTFHVETVVTRSTLFVAFLGTYLVRNDSTVVTEA